MQLADSSWSFWSVGSAVQSRPPGLVGGEAGEQGGWKNTCSQMERV